MKRTLGVLLLLLLAALAIGLVLLRRGYSALAQPSHAEEVVARRLRHMATPAWARAQVNPLAASDIVLSDARVHFADHCSICHANDGSGDTAIGRGLYPRAPDMRKTETQALSDAEKADMKARNPRSPQEMQEEEDEEAFLRGEEPPAGRNHH